MPDGSAAAHSSLCEDTPIFDGYTAMQRKRSLQRVIASSALRKFGTDAYLRTAKKAFTLRQRKQRP